MIVRCGTCGALASTRGDTATTCGGAYLVGGVHPARKCVGFMLSVEPQDSAQAAYAIGGFVAVYAMVIDS